MSEFTLQNDKTSQFRMNNYKFTHGLQFTVRGDACPRSSVNAEACLAGWPNA